MQEARKLHERQLGASPDVRCTISQQRVLDRFLHTWNSKRHCCHPAFSRAGVNPVIPNPRGFRGVRDLLFGFHPSLIGMSTAPIQN